MRLLFVGTNRGGGGTESHFVTLVKAMQKEGHVVAAVVLANSPIHTGLQSSGIDLYFATFRNALDPRGISSVWRACSQFQPDWMIGSFSKEYWPLMMIANMRNIKLALFKHMDFPLRPLTHYMLPRLTDRFIVISDYMRRNFIARGIDPARIQVLYNPLDTGHFRPDPPARQTSRENLGIRDDEILIGYLGAMHPDKGIFVLTEAVHLAMAEMPTLRMLWAGEGPAEQEFKAKIEHGGFRQRHRFLKWTADVRPLYAAMDILAMPSIGLETFGRVSLEAQACGVPVLCSNNGGMPETIAPDDVDRLIFPGDIPAWKNAILKMAQEIQLHHQVRGKERAWVEQQFKDSVIAKRFTGLLDKTDSR